MRRKHCLSSPICQRVASASPIICYVGGSNPPFKTSKVVDGIGKRVMFVVWIVDHMLFVLFLMVWWLAHLAASCMHHGKRDRYDRQDRRDKGIFRIGRLYLLDLERKTSYPENLKNCLLFRKSSRKWCFSLRF